MVPRSTVGAQCVKHNPPLHAKPRGGPAQRALKASKYEHRRIYPPPVTGTAALKKGSDTLLRSAPFYFEVSVVIEDLFIYLHFFSSTSGCE